MRRDGIHVLTSSTFSSLMLCAGQGHANELGPLQAITHKGQWDGVESNGARREGRQTEQVLGEASPHSYVSDTTMWKSKSTCLPQTCSFSCKCVVIVMSPFLSHGSNLYSQTRVQWHTSSVAPRTRFCLWNTSFLLQLTLPGWGPFLTPAVLLGWPPTPLLPSVHFAHCWQNKRALFTHFPCGSSLCGWSKQTPEHGIWGAPCSSPILSCQNCHCPKQPSSRQIRSLSSTRPSPNPMPKTPSPLFSPVKIFCVTNLSLRKINV